MDCGSQDAVCELTNWVSENELIGPWVAEIVGHSSNFVKDYGQAFIGLVGVSLGFWRWWRYREHILHKRLAEYLRESDERLVDSTAQFLEAIQRPGPGQRPNDPLFVNHDLRAVLRERNWDNEVGPKRRSECRLAAL